MSKKRANGEGTIFQRSKDKIWVGRIPIGYKPNGSIKMHIVYGRTQKEVKECVFNVRYRRTIRDCQD